MFGLLILFTWYFPSLICLFFNWSVEPATDVLLWQPAGRWNHWRSYTLHDLPLITNFTIQQFVGKQFPPRNVNVLFKISRMQTLLLHSKILTKTHKEELKQTSSVVCSPGYFEQNVQLISCPYCQLMASGGKWEGSKTSVTRTELLNGTWLTKTHTEQLTKRTQSAVCGHHCFTEMPATILLQSAKRYDWQNHTRTN